MSVDEAVAWLGRFDLAELAEFNPFTLSQGQKRRLSVAAMMVRGQQALILDEPTFGQDREQSERLMSTLVALNNEGRTVLVVTHDLELVARYAKRVLVLAAGRLVFDGAPTHLFDGRHLPESWGLTMPLAPRLCRDLQAADLWRPAGGPALAVSDFLLRAGTPDRPRSARTVEAAWV